MAHQDGYVRIEEGALVAGGDRIGSSALANDGTFASPPVAADAVLYVTQEGSDTNTGLSWGKAFATVSKALSVLVSLGTGGTVNVGAGTFLTGSTLHPSSGVLIRGAGRTTTVLECSGAGAVVEIQGGGNWITFEHVSLVTTGITGTEVGVQMDPNTFSNLFHDCAINGQGVAGQKGVNLTSSDAGGCYWNAFVDCQLLSWDISISLDNPTGATANTNRNFFTNTRIYSTTTVGIFFGKSSGNQVTGLSIDQSANALGLHFSATSIHDKVVNFECELGAGSKSYQVDASCVGAVIIGTDNCPTASTDAGTGTVLMTNSAVKFPENFTGPQVFAGSGSNHAIRVIATATSGYEIWNGATQIGVVVADAGNMYVGAASGKVLQLTASNGTGGVVLGGASDKAGLHGVTIAQAARSGQLTDNSGGASGGATIAAIPASANDADGAKLSATQNAIATLAAKVNALEIIIHNKGITA